MTIHTDGKDTVSNARPKPEAQTSIITPYDDAVLLRGMLQRYSRFASHEEFDAIERFKERCGG